MKIDDGGLVSRTVDAGASVGHSETSSAKFK